MRYTAIRTISQLKQRLSGDDMNIKDLRTTCGMTITAFSEYLGIPYRTIQDWEREVRTPPEYVVKLIEYKLKHEGLI